MNQTNQDKPVVQLDNDCVIEPPFRQYNVHLDKTELVQFGSLYVGALFFFDCCYFVKGNGNTALILKVAGTAYDYDQYLENMIDLDGETEVIPVEADLYHLQQYMASTDGKRGLLE